MIAQTLMIQGTGSSVGKSLLVTAFCRLFARRGIRVSPFKAQNMSNNAAVCADGSEIARSQQLQAIAARIEPSADMNPILLKPEADSRSQVIVAGRPWRTLDARVYFQSRREIWPIVTASLDRLRRAYDLVIMEGAGSPAECNLGDREIVNMAVAQYAGSPVVLVGDIDRGGVFAQLLGTLWLLEAEERALVRGLIVNKFRGDSSLFDDGVSILKERGGVPVLGVVPWLPGLDLPEEDAVALDRLRTAHPPRAGELEIAVIRFPRIANFDDFDPVAAEPGVRVTFVDRANQLQQPSAIILPGTKSTIADLAWLHETGLAESIKRLAASGAAVVGICGGYQMLGRVIRDPEAVESSCSEAVGLGLLPVETIFAAAKLTSQIRAIVDDDRHCRGCHGSTLDGYEIHMGRTTGARPWLRIRERHGASADATDGAVSDDGRIWGCYLHGLFAADAFRRAWLASLADRSEDAPTPGAGGAFTDSGSAAARLDQSLDRLADGVERAIDMDQLERIVGNLAKKGE